MDVLRQTAVVLALASASPLTAQSMHTVHGLVGGQHGRPVSGARVSLGGMVWTTEPDGRFTLTGLGDGRHEISVDAAGYHPVAFSFSLESGMPGTIDLGLVPLEPAPPVHITLAGTVTDSAYNRPVDEAQVFVGGLMAAVTDPSGRFAAQLEVQPGTHLVLVRSLGHRFVGYELEIIEAGSVTVDVTLPVAAFMLPGISVTQTEITGRLSGFVRRMESEIGQFLTPADVDRIRPQVLTTTDLLVRIPGVRFRPSRLGNVLSVARCGRPELFLDGIPLEAPYLDQATTVDQIAAVEVYSDPGRIPAQFNRMQPRRGASNFGACGVIVLWTRIGERAR